MGMRRKAVRAKKKLVVLTGTEKPGTDMHRLLAFHSFDAPQHILRVASQARVTQEANALSKKFPEIGKRLQGKKHGKKMPLHEKREVLKKLELLGPQRIENGLKRGFGFQELLRYPNKMEISAFLKRVTPERVKIMKGLGLKDRAARNACLLFETRTTQEIRNFFAELKKRGVDPNKVNMGHFELFSATGKCDFDLIAGNRPNIIEAIDRNRAIEIARTRNAVIFRRRMGRFIDFKRHGRPVYARQFKPSSQAKAALEKNGIKAFEFNGKMKRVVSTNPIVGMKQRHAFYMEVPEISQLLKEARPKRQHLNNVLAYADIMLLPKTGKQPGRIMVYELQSDIIRNLGPKNREKYANWAELAILGLADFAAKKGYKDITISSPHMVKQVWPSLGKKTLKELYYDLPQKMGFRLMQSTVKYRQVDSGFGKQVEGESNIFWEVNVSELKKRYRAFFK